MVSDRSEIVGHPACVTKNCLLVGKTPTHLVTISIRSEMFCLRSKGDETGGKLRLPNTHPISNLNNTVTHFQHIAASHSLLCLLLFFF